MKRLAVWMMLVACVAIGATPLQAAAAASSSKVDIVIDGSPLKLENSPSAYVEKGRTLVPVRDVFSQLGLNVNWDQKANTATISDENTTIKMQPGVKQVTVNGNSETVEVPVAMKENRLFIPIRFVMEKVGLEIDWDKDENVVYLEVEASEEETPEGEDGEGEEEPTEPTEPAEGKEVEDTEAFLKELIEANEELNSYSLKADIKQSMSADGEEMEMDMTMNMDIVMDPLGFYQHMTMALAGIEDLEEDGEMTVESYFTKDGYYMYEAMLDEWVKYDDDMFDDLSSLTDFQMDPQMQYELMTKFIDDLKVYEYDNTYELQFNVTNEGFAELLDFIMGLPELGLEDVDLSELDELGMDISIDNMSIVQTLDKETLFPLADELETEMTISVEDEELDEEMTISQSGSMTYTKHNEIEEIVIPQEIIDSAISFEEYLDKLEEMFEEEIEATEAA